MRRHLEALQQHRPKRGRNRKRETVERRLEAGRRLETRSDTRSRPRRWVGTPCRGRSRPFRRRPAGSSCPPGGRRHRPRPGSRPLGVEVAEDALGGGELRDEGDVHARLVADSPQRSLPSRGAGAGGRALEERRRCRRITGARHVVWHLMSRSGLPGRFPAELQVRSSLQHRALRWAPSRDAGRPPQSARAIDRRCATGAGRPKR